MNSPEGSRYGWGKSELGEASSTAGCEMVEVDTGRLVRRFFDLFVDAIAN